MRRRCLFDGCTVLVTRGSYCVAHLPYRGEWNYLRATVLRRDDYRCQIKGSLCKGRATTVDHIDGNALNNQPQNLRAACRPCNTSKGGVA